MNKFSLCFLLLALTLCLPAEEAQLLFHCSFDEGDLTSFTCQPGDVLKPRLKGEPAKVALVEGVHGKALELKEGCKVKYVPGKPDALLGLTPPFTIALWMKKTAEAPKHDIFLATISDQKEQGGFELFWHWKRAMFRWGKNDNENLISPAGLLYLNKWHHIAVTHDGKTIIMYVDAIAVAQKEDNGTFKPLPQAKYKKYRATIGHYPTNFNAYQHVGMLDDIYVFSKALNAEEITRLAAAQPHREQSEIK